MARKAAALAAEPAPEIDFGELPMHIGYVLRRAQLRVWEDFYEAMKGTGISPALFSALTLVERNPGLQQGHLGEALGVARSGAMSMVDRLEGLGLVERRAAPHDRRAYGLHITSRGLEAMGDLRKRLALHRRRITRSLSQEEVKQLMALLVRI